MNKRVLIAAGVSLVLLGVGFVAGQLFSDNEAVATNRVGSNLDAPSSSLVTFLEERNSGCDQLNQQGTYWIISEDSERFAKVVYGCGYADAYSFAVHSDGQWEMITPTNQFSAGGVPSCEMVDEYEISQEVARDCIVDMDELQQSAPELRTVTYQ